MALFRCLIFMINNISIFGLGKLGASMVAGMASRGFNVIGVDVSKHAVNAVNAVPGAARWPAWGAAPGGGARAVARNWAQPPPGRDWHGK